MVFGKVYSVFENFSQNNTHTEYVFFYIFFLIFLYYNRFKLGGTLNELDKNLF